MFKLLKKTFSDAQLSLSSSKRIKSKPNYAYEIELHNFVKMIATPTSCTSIWTTKSILSSHVLYIALQTKKNLS